MNIHTLQFVNKTDGWEIQKMSFQQLNLLVGASGVGKTQILQAINTLKRIADGTSFSGIQWKIEFSTDNGDEYLWEGESEDTKMSLQYFDLERKENKVNLQYEKIHKNGTLILERSHEKIKFNNYEIPKLTLDTSIVTLLKEEELIKPIYNNFEKIIHTEELGSYIFRSEYGFKPVPYSIIDDIISLEDIQNTLFSSEMKLFIAYLREEEIFKTIKERYCKIFRQIEDIKIDSIESYSYYAPDYFSENVFIQIKHKNSDKWIPSVGMSSGMFRTLLLLSEIYLCADGSVILIDEFENSLGINCIRDITDEILFSDRNVQCIITSHHPYIINNIEFQYWKLLTRNGGTIKTHDITKKLSEKSRHERFMQLIQLEEYETGLEEVL